MKNFKKISYLSAIIIVIGSTIGAGIFFKNKELFENAQGNLGLVISSWSVAGVGIIALGIAIVEMISASKSNRGVIEWCHNFMPKWLAKSTKNYLQLIFLPISIFTLSVYAVSSLNEAGLNINALGGLGIGAALTVWIFGINYISLKSSEKLQWVLTLTKFFPLFLLPIIAFVGAGVNDVPILDKPFEQKTGLTGAFPQLVIMSGIPAIIFAFDGFYEVASLRNDLKKPKKIGSVIVLGASIILAIYIFLTVAFALGSRTGTHNDIFSETSGFFKKNGHLIRAFNAMIGVGIIAIMNGWAMAGVERSLALYNHDDLPALKRWENILAKFKIKTKDKRKIAWSFTFFMTMIYFVVFGFIGIYVYKPGDHGMGAYEEFSDVIVNYTSSLSFGAVSLCVIGAMINRKTNRIKTEKHKLFWPAAIFSTIIMMVGILYQFVAAIINATGYNGSNTEDEIVKLVIFVAIILITGIITYWEMKSWKLKTILKIKKS